MKSVFKKKLINIKDQNVQFGILFSLLFLILALLNFNLIVNYFFYFLSFIFLILSILIPFIFNPLKIIWLHFGNLIHKIISPLIILIVFLLIITPISMLKKLFNNKSLKLKFDKKNTSYWTKNKFNEKNSFDEQF